MQTAQSSVFVQVIQWVNVFVQILYPIALVIVLVLAYVEFRKLVKRLAPVPKATTTEKAKEKA